MATIKAIESSSVHQIQSGQVIIDLCSVVKELVENSLDAGATSIEVRFKNQGLDAIEIQDNGKGIAPEDFDNVALKHYTSKLSNYEDLSGLDTFGFRGEALSSLCALSKLRIFTARNADGPVGKQLEFEVSGQLKSTSVAATPKGTTVYAENLFYNLPVRRKELEKNIKREYGKVVGLLHAYACVGVGVRLSVSNQMPKGKKVSVFSTMLNMTTKENITNIFGAKAASALVALDLRLEMARSDGRLSDVLVKNSALAQQRSEDVRIEGHISKPVFGEGRQAPDRQMLFVNSRPCLLPQVSKAINEVYKSFNVSQSPFIFANLIMDTNAYDVNVSPDKRTILLHDQSAMLDRLKTVLTELFEGTDHTIPIAVLPNRRLPLYQPLTRKRQDTTTIGSSPEGSEQIVDGDNIPGIATNVTPSSGSDLVQQWVGKGFQDRKTGTNSDSRKSTRGNRVPKPQLPFQDDHQDDSQPSTEGSTCDSTASHISDERHTESISVTLGKPSLDSQARAGDIVTYERDDVACSQELGISRDDVSCTIDDRSTPEAIAAKRARAGSNISEQLIPTFTPGSQKSTAGPVQNAFDRMRPKRMAPEIAHITIGDETVTTIIGSGTMFKKRRIRASDDATRTSPWGINSRLSRDLRQKFAAPRSQLQIDADRDDRSTDDQSESDPQEAETRGEVESDGDARDGSDDEHEAEPGSEAMSDQPMINEDTDSSDDLFVAPVEYEHDANGHSAEGEEEDQEREGNSGDEHSVSRGHEDIAQLISPEEDDQTSPVEEYARRASKILSSSSGRKDATTKLVQVLDTSTARSGSVLAQLMLKCRVTACSNAQHSNNDATIKQEDLDAVEAENRLSLTVLKSDFASMQIVGQFNLGFILAVRPSTRIDSDDDLFIIDQHAADEKYNYERLQKTVTLQSQRLVQPKLLELTAVEEEVVLNSTAALKANGFEIETTSQLDESLGSSRRVSHLLTLPMSRERTFEISDLEELLHLLSEQPSGACDIPRPRKVQTMLAMRACRSSIMIGRTLTSKHMKRVVCNMGEMEKPWNCPHGRPTMRHLAGLTAWHGWKEGDVVSQDEHDSGNAQKGSLTDWRSWIGSRQSR